MSEKKYLVTKVELLDFMEGFGNLMIRKLGIDDAVKAQNPRIDDEWLEEHEYREPTLYTDRVRRHIAEQLAYCALDTLDSGGLLPTLKRLLEVEGTWRDVLAKMAELIEPGPELTCRRDKRENCTVCGDHLGRESVYCKHCGSRVVKR